MMQDACAKGYVIDTQHSGKCLVSALHLFLKTNKNITFYRLIEKNLGNEQRPIYLKEF